MSTEEKPIYNIVGELVALGPVRRELLPLYQRWINDFGTTRTLAGAPAPYTAEMETEWFDRIAKDRDTIIFTIYEKTTGRPIGNTDISIDHRNRAGVFGIMIGEADARGKGYGTEVTRLMLDYAFTVQGLHSMMLTVFEFNRAGIRCYEKAGYRVFGRRRECLFMGGRLWDVLYMDCLASEFQSPLLAKILRPDEQ